MAVARIERIDREVAELNSERASAVQEYEKLYADLTSGRAVGDAIAALGLTVAPKASGRAKRSSRVAAAHGCQKWACTPRRGSRAGRGDVGCGWARRNERAGDVPQQRAPG